MRTLTRKKVKTLAQVFADPEKELEKFSRDNCPVIEDLINDKEKEQCGQDLEKALKRLKGETPETMPRSFLPFHF